jgi:hypothetical protein
VYVLPTIAQAAKWPEVGCNSLSLSAHFSTAITFILLEAPLLKMGQVIFCDIKKKKINGDKATSISSPSEPSCDYDENLIDKVSSASYGAGLDIQQSQISGDVPSEDILTTKDYYSGSTAAKFSLIPCMGSVETDENAIDKVSSASYAAGILFENEEGE